MSGHSFQETHFNSPTFCGNCDKFIWGLMGKQGHRCINCKLAVHKKCYVAGVSVDCGVAPVEFTKYSELLQGVRHGVPPNPSAAPAGEAGAAPPPETPRFVATKTFAFNHVNEYLIHDQHLWYRPRQHKNDLVETGADYPNAKPVELTVDGANLVVMDQNRTMHYKKVLLEEDGYWKGTEYYMKDQSADYNWVDKWFVIPVVSTVINFLSGKDLELAENYHSWAITHRGQFNHYLEDRIGRRHPVQTGCTTLFALNEDGNLIRYFDPWKPKTVAVVVPTPETVLTSFRALSISAAASTMFIIGFAVSPGMYTFLADLDSLAWNPFLKYTYDINSKDEEQDVQPLPCWQRQALPPLTGRAEICRNSCITQTGEGNNAKQLRVEGRNAQGVPGFWYRMITAAEWEFKADDSCCKPELGYAPLDLQRQLVLPAPKRNFKATRAKHYSGQADYYGQKLSFAVKDWSEYQMQCAFYITVDGVTTEFNFIRKEALLEKIVKNGKEAHNWDLVLLPDAKNTDLPKSLQHLFHGHRYVPCKALLNEKKELHIKNRHWQPISLGGTLLGPEVLLTKYFEFTLAKKPVQIPAPIVPRPEGDTPIDLCFEGGGAKGLAYVPILDFLEKSRYIPRRIVGTSAGAITVAAMALGYSAAEVDTKMREKTKEGLPVFSSFMDGLPLSHFEGEAGKARLAASTLQSVFSLIDLPLIPEFLEQKFDQVLLASFAKHAHFRALFSLEEYGGLFVGNAFLEFQWMRGLVREKGFNQDITLHQLRLATNVDLNIVSSDVTGRQKLVLNARTAPDLPVAWAVRASMSIPFLWQEVTWKQSWGKYLDQDLTGHVLVDGGVLSNFALDLLLLREAADTQAVMGPPPDPVLTVGFLLDETLPVAGMPEEQPGFFSQLVDKLKIAGRLGNFSSLLLSYHDDEVGTYRRNGPYICRLPAQGYGTTEFDMSDERRDALLDSANAAVRIYFRNRAAAAATNVDELIHRENVLRAELNDVRQRLPPKKTLTCGDCNANVAYRADPGTKKLTLVCPKCQKPQKINQ